MAARLHGKVILNFSRFRQFNWRQLQLCCSRLSTANRQSVVHGSRGDHVIISSWYKKRANELLSTGKGIASDYGKNVKFEKENIWTIPNLLTFSRILASPVVGYLIITQHYVTAVSLFAAASATDLLDGVIARRFPSQSSRLGSILDPLADKILVSILYGSLTFVHLIPLPLTVLILSRDAVLIAGSFYVRYLIIPPPKTWSKFWDIERSGFKITPNLLGKVTSFLKM
jgi:cardiolipin synthase